MLNKIYAMAICAALPFSMIQASHHHDSHHDSIQELHVISVSNPGTPVTILTPTFTPLTFPNLIVKFGYKDKILPSTLNGSEYQLTGGTYEISFVGTFELVTVPTVSGFTETFEVAFILNGAVVVNAYQQSFPLDTDGAKATVTLTAVITAPAGSILQVAARDISTGGSADGEIQAEQANLTIERINETFGNP